VKDKLIEIREHLRKKGVDYADLRHESSTTQQVRVRNDEVEKVSEQRNSGVGIRVIYNGAWGFAAASSTADEDLRKTADMALEVAKASAMLGKKKIKLAPAEPVKGSFRSPCEKDPFGVPVADKISVLLESTATLQKEDRIRVAEGSMRFNRKQKLFLNTEGTEVEQEITVSGGGIEATAVSENDAQKRSYPTGHGGDFATRGFEFITDLDFPGHAEKVREDVVALLDAPACPDGEFDIILLGTQMALQIHESCGHPIELDRVLGTELSYAGGSFLSVDKLGGFQYGSDIVNITADATIPGGMGTFGYDDEGVPAQRYDIIRGGYFQGYLSSRETAPVIGRTSGGAMRASSWSCIPLIRMTNINLEPGEGTLEELIADTKKGLLMDANKVWSIDDMRVNFQFGCEIGWEIENGKLGRIVKNPSYSGITPEFWGACDAICGPEEWHVWGVANCGKGEPGQTIGTGHGTSPARFKSIQVGASQ